MPRQLQLLPRFPKREGEEWVDVSGWEDRYAISSHGRCISKARRIQRSGSFGSSNRSAQLLTQRLNTAGYVQYAFYRNQGGGEGNQEEHLFLAHRLVARHFIGPPPTEKHVVNHIDNDPSNNRVGNLEWCTYAENRFHGMVASHLKDHGEEDTRARLENWLSQLS